MLQQTHQYTYCLFIFIIISLSSCYTTDYPYGAGFNDGPNLWWPIDSTEYENENSNFDIEFLAEELPDTANIGDILHLIGQIVNHGPDSYFGYLELSYVVIDSFPPTPFPFYVENDIETADSLMINSNGLSSQDGLDIDETVYFEDSQNIIVSEENFRKGQKNIIIIWPVDLMSDSNPNNNIYFKDIYIRE